MKHPVAVAAERCHDEVNVSSGRLTRQELGWLLAQEARGAAKALRHGLSMPPPPLTSPLITEGDPAAIGVPGAAGATTPPPPDVETTLNNLDDAINLLSHLESNASKAGKGRRGRIDIAALFYELAPSARIAIEPGAGTEVFGDESELRRMFHVLTAHSRSLGSGASGEIQIRREDEWVRVSVDLGPDTVASSEIDRRWLSRMAVRQGGRLELAGSSQAILLPADASGDQSEVAELRAELDQAQQLGEAYAREIANAFSAGPLPGETVHPESADAAELRFLSVVAMAGSLARTLKPVFEGLYADAGIASNTLGEDSEVAQNLTRRVSTGYEIVGELTRIGACPTDEKVEEVATNTLIRDVVSDSEARAARYGVELVVEAAEGLTVQTRPKVLALALRALVDQAIAATPRGKGVQISLTRPGPKLRFCVEDGGPVVPDANRRDIAQHLIDPSSLGRPAGIAMLVASACLGYIGSGVSIGESAKGRAQVSFSLALE